MQSVREEGAVSGFQVEATDITKLTQKEKKVIPFRHSQIADLPCMSRLPCVPGGMSGCDDQGSELNQTGNDPVQLPRYRIIGTPDIRLEAANLLIAIREHDKFMTEIGKMYLDLAITCLDDARQREAIHG